MLDLISKHLQKIDQLFIEGSYFEALEALTNYEQKKDLSSEEQIFCLILKSNIYYELGRSADALKCIEQAHRKSEKIGNNLFIIDVTISKAWILLGVWNYEEVSELLSKGEELLSQLTRLSQKELAKRKSLLKIIKSAFFFHTTHNIDKALEYGEQGLQISEEYGHFKEIALALHFNSTYYFRIGNLDRALNFLERALKVQRTYRKLDDWRTLKDLGVLKGIIGELDLALDYTEQGLAIVEKMGNKNFIAQFLNNASLIYRQKGNLVRAMEVLERSLTIWEELDLKLNLIGALDSLFIVSLDTKSLKKAEKYLKRMQQINEQVKDDVSDVACRVNNALLLKMSSNTLDKEKAKKLLQNIVKEEILNWEFTERALLHLCDIYLIELQSFNKQEIINEVHPLINRLSEFAEFQHSFRLLAETHLLQGKLALIQMNMGDARKFFTKAERIADEHGLHLLARTISSEHDLLLEQLEKWETLRKVNTPVAERVKFVEIDKTINHLMGRRMLEPPDLVEEDPILLLIMSEGGHTFFNHTFIKDWDYNSLFSSFISAFNTFSSEIFEETIDRIKIGENIIFIKPVDPFVVCYVSKGQSYPAIKKLNKFSDAIKNKKEIWAILNKASMATQELNIKSSPLLGAIVNKIFE